MKYATLKDGLVEVVYLEKPANIDTVEVPDDVFSGYSVNEDGAYHAPDAEKLPPRREGEFREFMELFTDDEQLGVISATQTDANIKRWYDKAMGGATFSLDHLQTDYGLTALVSVGLLTASRKAEILGADFDA